MQPPASELLALRARETTYPGTAEHVSTVRADLRLLLHDCPIADDVILCASELAANAATHSRSCLPGGTFTVRILIAEETSSASKFSTTAASGLRPPPTPPDATASTSSAHWLTNGARTAAASREPPGPSSTGHTARRPVATSGHRTRRGPLPPRGQPRTPPVAYPPSRPRR